MTRTLRPSTGLPVVLTATTTAQLARRMLQASRSVADRMPTGLHGSPGLDILLALHIAEEDARYMTVKELMPPGSLSPSITRRWVRALEDYDFVERRGETLALSPHGHSMLSTMLKAIYAVQRTLD